MLKTGVYWAEKKVIHILKDIMLQIYKIHKK